MYLCIRMMVFGLIGLCSLPVTAQNSTLTPQRVLAEIDDEGVRVVFERLYREKISTNKEGYDPFPSSENWLYMMKQIQQGDAAWLDVARILLLTSAISRALPNNPARVLSLLTVGTSLNVGTVCAPRIFDDYNPQYDQAIEARLNRDYLRRAEAVLVKFKAPQLEPQRLACLENIQAEKCALTHCKTPVSRQHRAAWNQAPAPTHTAFTAESLLQEIEKQSTEAVVARLWTKNQGRDWSAVLGNIEQGNAAWLEVAQRLIGVTLVMGASSDSDIYHAVARALPRAPIPVLRLLRARDPELPMDLRVGGSFAHGRVCAEFPYPDGNEEVANLRFVSAAEAALLTVQEPDLATHKEACLLALRDKLRQYLPKAKNGNRK